MPLLKAVSGNPHAQLGARVKFVNLHSSPELNEKEGTICEFYRNGRVGVQLKHRHGKGKVSTVGLSSQQRVPHAPCDDNGGANLCVAKVMSVQEKNLAVAVEQCVHEKTPSRTSPPSPALSSASSVASRDVFRPKSVASEILWLPLHQDSM